MKFKDLKKLSQSTIDELVALVGHFDCGAEINVNVDDCEISVVGVDMLSEQGSIQVRRVYDFDYNIVMCDEKSDTSDEMIEQIKEDDLVLKKADLDKCYEDAREVLEL